MRVMRKLMLANLKQNKRRTIITIMGTAVAVAMVTAIAVLLATVLETARTSTIENIGNWHVRFNKIDSRAIPLLQGNNIEYVDYSYEEGFAQLPDREGNTRSTLAVVGYSPDSYARLPIVLSEGRLPEKPGEIVLSDEFLQTSAKPWPLGETVELDFGYYGYGELGDDGKVPFEYRSRGNSSGIGNADWYSEGTRPFTVVGYGDIGRLQSGWYAGFTALTVFDPTAVPDGEFYMSAHVGFKDIREDTSGQAGSLSTALQSYYTNEVGVDNYPVTMELNSRLLGLSGVFSSSRIFWALALFSGGLLVIILVGSVSLISNAFSISLSERVKSLGMMASVGATKRQKRGSVLFEAAFIGLFAIPIGIVGGVAGIGFTLLFLGQYIGGFFDSNTTAHLVVPWQMIVFATVFSAGMLLLSAWRPARLASKIGPIDAVRGAPDALAAQKTRSGKWMGKLFGFEAELGVKNSMRSRKRYRAILSSLAISLVLFLVGSAGMGYLRQSIGTVEGYQTPYNAAVDISFADGATCDDYSEALALAEEISELPDAGQTVLRQSFHGSFNAVPDLVTEDARAMLPQNEDGTYPMQLQLYAMDDASIARWCEQAGLDPAILNAGDGRGIPAVLLTPLNTHTPDGAFTATVPSVLETGDQFVLPFADMGLSVSADNALDIVATSPVFPDNMRNAYAAPESLPFVTTLDAVESLTKQMWEGGYPYFGILRLDVQSDNAEDFYAAVEKMEKPDGLQTMVLNVSDDIGRNSQLLLVVEVLTYGFVILITLVCMANIFNTVSTGMLLRAREFAVLRSCGLTPKGFNRMTDCETLFYGLRALIIGLPASLLFSWLLYRALNMGFGIPFMLPWKAYLIAVLGVFVLVGLSMLYARGKLRKFNIAESMKNENW